MPRKKEVEPTWIGVTDTLAILKRNNGREIAAGYLYILFKQGKIDRKKIDERAYLYSKEDAERIHIAAKPGAGRKKKKA